MQVKLKSKPIRTQFSSAQFSHSVVSGSLQSHGLQHTRLPCPSPTPRACSNSCASSWWCHPTISSSVIPFFSRLQSFLASGSFPMSQFFTSGGQSIEASASVPVLQMNIQDWFSLGLTGLISLQPKGFSKVFSNTTVRKHQNTKALVNLFYRGNREHGPKSPICWVILQENQASDRGE